MVLTVHFLGFAKSLCLQLHFATTDWLCTDPNNIIHLDMGMRLNSHLLQFLYLLRNFRFRKIKLLHILSLLLEDEMTSMGFASIIPASTKSYMLMARCLFIITSYSFEQQLKAKNISIRKYQFIFFFTFLNIVFTNYF